jgi:hypothetical protein
MGKDVQRYAAALEVYAASLPQTYGQEKVRFFYAQPTDALVPGIAKPRIKNGKGIEISAWPESLKDIASRLGALAAEQ